MTRKAAIYIRVSTQEQHTDRQKEELSKLAKDKGYEVTDIYMDILSGFKDVEDRPELNSLLADSNQNKFDLVLFSELSRLSRTIAHLNKYIEVFLQNNIELYFQKQILWVRNKAEIGTIILTQVLGVISEYEIELFKERSMSGKISGVKNRGINIGGFTAYGYKSEEGTKRLVIDENEKPTVERIFKLYASGKKAQYICDLLNSEGVPSPYSKRIAESKEKRKEKGLKEKDYKRFDPDRLVWVASSLNKMLKNPLYTGKRSFKIKNKKTSNESDSNIQNHELIEIKDNELIKIIDDRLFDDVQLRMKENRLVKNTATKHPTLLKSMLKCGSCGRNMVSIKANGDFSYMCYGKLKDAKTRLYNCVDSMRIVQYKLDGLVVQLIIHRLADADRIKKSTKRIEELTIAKEEQLIILNSKVAELNKEKKSWYRYYKKSAHYNIPEEEIQKTKDEIDLTSNRLSNEIDRMNKELNGIDKTIQSITAMTKSENFNQQEATIRDNKELLKNLTDEFVERVIVYPIFDKYSLVIVNFKDGGEVWGTIKSSKYKNVELWFDTTYCKQPHFIYQFWNNDDNSAKYNHENKTVVYKGKTSTITINTNPNKDKTRFDVTHVEGKNPIIRLIPPVNDSDNSNFEEVTVSDSYITIKDGIYPIREFIDLLKEDNENGYNSNGDFPPYDFHEGEEGEEDNETNKWVNH